MADTSQSSGVQARREGGNWRQWAIGVALALLAIVALQNSQEVEVEVLFVNTTAPLIAILLIAAALGAAVGYLAPVLRRHRRQLRHRDDAG